jgi:Outer membrane protein beta-barrel domain
MRKLLAALALAAGGAFAQTGGVWVSFGESLIPDGNLGTTAAFGGNASDVKLTNGFRFGFRFGFDQGDRFGHEFGYAYNRTQLNVQGVEQGMAIHQGGYNFLYYFNKPESKARPFVTGGVQFDNFVPPGSSAASGGGNTKFGFNYGAGVKVKLPSIYSMRFDFRQYMTGHPFDLPLSPGFPLNQFEISAGFGVGF